MRTVMTIVMWFSLILLSGCGGCGRGEKDVNKSKDVPTVGAE